MVDVGRQLFDITLADLASRFEINGWEGPFARTPEETAQEQAVPGPTRQSPVGSVDANAERADRGLPQSL